MKIRGLVSCLFVLLGFFISSLSVGQTLTFKLRGETIKTISLSELKKMSQPLTITVVEPHEAQKVQYQVIDFSMVLSHVYGKKWQGMDEALFTCLDGYQPSIAIQKIKSHQAFLAYERIGANQFELMNTIQNEKVSLEPFYLVWENIKDQVIARQGASGWPYQVIEIDLVMKKSSLAEPKSNVSEEVKRGFKYAKTHCMTCHAVNGEGGVKAPDLNYPVSFYEIRGDQWLKKWIDNPRSLNPNSNMPAFESNVGNDREKAINDIVAYLKEMKNNKVKPK